MRMNKIIISILVISMLLLNSSFAFAIELEESITTSVIIDQEEISLEGDMYEEECYWILSNM